MKIANAVEMEQVRKQLNLNNGGATEGGGGDQAQRPLIVVVDQRKQANDDDDDIVDHGLIENTMDPEMDRRKEFVKKSKQACGGFCDFSECCSFHGCSSCLIILYIIDGLLHLIIASILLEEGCNQAIHNDLSSPMNLNHQMPYSCKDIRFIAYGSIIDATIGIFTSLIGIMALIRIQHSYLVPVILFGFASILYRIGIIVYFPDFVNASAIGGILLSAVWVLVFYRTYRIMKRVNREWPSLEMMQAQKL